MKVTYAFNNENKSEIFVELDVPKIDFGGTNVYDNLAWGKLLDIIMENTAVSGPICFEDILQEWTIEEVWIDEPNGSD